MSRHRDVRNLDYDELLDDEAAQDSMTPAESEQLDAAVDQIVQTLGSTFSIKEITDTAWYYYFDVEKSTNYLLDQHAKKQEKQRKAQANQEQGTSTLGPEVSDTSASNDKRPAVSDESILDSTFHSMEPLTANHMKSNTSQPKKLSKLQQLAQTKAAARKAVIASTLQQTTQSNVCTEEKAIEPRNSSVHIDQTSAKGDNLVNDEETFDENQQNVDDLVEEVTIAQFLRPSDYAVVVLGGAAHFISNAQASFKQPSPDDKIQKAQSASKGNVVSEGNRKGTTVAAIAIDAEKKPATAANKPRTGRPSELAGGDFASFVVVGHVDAGKSTLFGRLLYDLGSINERAMQKLRNESSKAQKSSFAFAWAMDSSSEERERGVTIDIATNTFVSENKTFTILDAPGHKDFVPNMIAGASQADFAVLVVDASRGAFESGFDAAGQTKEHAILIRSLGIQRIVIAVNKLDNVNWSQERFKDISVQLSTFLAHSGFDVSALSFVPCSGLTGANVATAMQNTVAPWYSGRSLLQEMSSMPVTIRDEKGDFRMIISDIQASQNSSNITILGRVSSGELQVNDTVVCRPSSENALVKSLLTGDRDGQAFAGDNVTLTLADIDPIHLRIGDVLCHADALVPNVRSFDAQMVTFQMTRPLLSGSSVVLHRGRADLAAVIKKIQIVDKAKGGLKSSRHVLGNSQARITLELVNGILPLETFTNNKDLGRIILRREGDTVAAGVVIALL